MSKEQRVKIGVFFYPKPQLYTLSSSTKCSKNIPQKWSEPKGLQEINQPLTLSQEFLTMNIRSA